MSELFKTYRFFTFSALIISSAVVLGLAANFATLFLPHIDRPFVVFALIVPSGTIVILTLVLMRSMPSTDLGFLFLLAVGWLTMGAWSTDVIGNVQCFGLQGTQPTKNNGTMPLTQYCYEMKSIEAFSWANFAVMTICFLIILILASRAAAMGRPIWNESMSELPWFGQYGSPYGYGGGQMPMYYGGGGGPGGGQPYVIQQAPGHSVVIQPNPGGMPTVTQVPGLVNSGM